MSHTNKISISCIVLGVSGKIIKNVFTTLYIFYSFQKNTKFMLALIYVKN